MRREGLGHAKKEEKKKKKKEAGERKEAKALHFKPQLIAPISISSVALLGYFSMAHGRWLGTRMENLSNIDTYPSGWVAFYFRELFFLG